MDRMVARVLGAMVLAGCAVAPVWAQESAWTQTFAFPNKGVVRRAEMPALVARRNAAGPVVLGTAVAKSKAPQKAPAAFEPSRATQR